MELCDNHENEAALVQSFETKAILALIAGCDRRNYRSLSILLNKHWESFNDQLKAEDDNPGQEESVKDALENFDFVARKIETLKRVIPVAGKQASFLKEFKLDRRLDNIKEALLGMHKCLKTVIEAELKK